MHARNYSIRPPLPDPCNPMLSQYLDRVRDGCTQTLASKELNTIANTLRSLGISEQDCVREAAKISERPDTQARLHGMYDAVVDEAPDVPFGSFERFVLAHTTRQSLDRLAREPVALSVKRLWCDALLRFTDTRATIRVSDQRFLALCKIASLRRFPAGQFDWEPSGLPRSWVPRVRPASALLKVVSLLALRWRGFNPAFYVHVTVTRPVHALLERDAQKAYHLMAQSMQLQPEIKGMIASSWFHSPDTFQITPHLSWLNRVFLENGGLVSTMGPASADCGVFHRSPDRQQAYDEGRFKPTLGLIIWPRTEMLAWAARHPELSS
jgi:hypothetical protein